MKTMIYKKAVGRKVLTASISTVALKGGEFFCVIYPDEKRGSKVSRYLTNFWEAESVLVNLGYKGEKDSEYKGIAIRWRERGIHNVMDAIHKEGWYGFLPPFPGTIFYDAESIPAACAEIDRLEKLYNSI